MAFNESTSLIDTLQKLTKANKLEWKLRNPPDSLLAGSESVVPLYFETNFKNRRFGIFEIRRREYDGENDNFYWFSSLGVAIFEPVATNVLLAQSFTDYGRTAPIVEVYQPQRELAELFELVRAAAANLGGLLAELQAELPDDEVPF